MAAPMDIDDLRAILVACAGEDEAAAVEGDIIDVPFEDLGYDSLALLDCMARIKQEHGVDLADDALAELTTPRVLLGLVNAQSEGARAA
ncbi:acyl carrier protein [Streptomyces sp. NPDC101152]|uniref:acyl carrier protein n=1 Tax=Streptomyces sp. NPDC101152 TaxID=3366116 RepID=UPI003826D477